MLFFVIKPLLAFSSLLEKPKFDVGHEPPMTMLISLITLANGNAGKRRQRWIQVTLTLVLLWRKNTSSFSWILLYISELILNVRWSFSGDHWTKLSRDPGKDTAKKATCENGKISCGFLPLSVLLPDILLSFKLTRSHARAHRHYGLCNVSITSPLWAMRCRSCIKTIIGQGTISYFWLFLSTIKITELDLQLSNRTRKSFSFLMTFWCVLSNIKWFPHRHRCP